MIHFDNVTKMYAHNGGPPTTVLTDLNLTAREGELVCLLGPSGCGKTTLLNLAAGFVFPSRGQVLFEDQPIIGPGPERGVVFQEANLFPWLTVSKNVAFGLNQKGYNGNQLAATVRRHLGIMGLSLHADKYPCALSGGMRQRVAIARVLALAPRVLLMDEPFSALDANTRERLQDELLRVRSGSSCQTVLYVTHSVAEAAYLADRVVILGHGNGKNVFLDLSVDLSHPRNRSGRPYLELKAELRAWLAKQPCCIQAS